MKILIIYKNHPNNFFKGSNADDRGELLIGQLDKKLMTKVKALERRHNQRFLVLIFLPAVQVTKSWDLLERLLKHTLDWHFDDETKLGPSLVDSIALKEDRRRGIQKNRIEQAREEDQEVSATRSK
jgi:hypothetical protein